MDTYPRKFAAIFMIFGVAIGGALGIAFVQNVAMGAGVGLVLGAIVDRQSRQPD